LTVLRKKNVWVNKIICINVLVYLCASSNILLLIPKSISLFLVILNNALLSFYKICKTEWYLLKKKKIRKNCKYIANNKYKEHTYSFCENHNWPKIWFLHIIIIIIFSNENFWIYRIYGKNILCERNRQKWIMSHI